MKGFVLPFLALILAVVIGMAALFIDFSRVYSTVVEQGAAADIGSINLLELYQDLDKVNSGEEPMPAEWLNAPVSFATVTPLDLQTQLGRDKLHDEKLKVLKWEIAHQLDDLGLTVMRGKALVEERTGITNLVSDIPEVFVDGLDGDSSSATDTQDATVVVEPGFWYFGDPGCGTGSAPASFNGCPCNGGVFDKQCFVRHSDDNTRAVNSMRLLAKTAENDPGKGFFSNFLGFRDTAKTDAEAISASAPRHVLFALDLSPSITYQTHPLRSMQDDANPATDCSLPLPNSGLPGPYAPEPCDAGTNSFLFAAELASADCSGATDIPGTNVKGMCQQRDVDSDPRYNKNWFLDSTGTPTKNPIGNLDLTSPAGRVCGCEIPFTVGSVTGLPVCALGSGGGSTLEDLRQTRLFNDFSVVDVNPNPSNGTSQTVGGVPINWPDTHAVNHYYCYDREDDMGNPAGDSWLLDGGPFVDSVPEPLFSAFAAIYESIEIIEDRSNAQDRLGLFGFDDDVPKTGVGRREIRDFGLPLATSSDIVEIKDLTDIDHADISEKNDHYQKLVNALMFPMMDSASHITEALNFAGTMWADLATRYPTDPSVSSSFADRNLVLVTDGQANCAAGLACEAFDWNVHITALGEMVTAAQGLIDSGIKIHVAFFNEISGPHNLVRQSLDNPAECMSDKEARKLRSENEKNGTADDKPDLGFYVDGGVDYSNLSNPFQDVIDSYETIPTYNGQTDDRYYYAGRFLYEVLVRPSGGLFIPIRPACDYAALGFASQAACNAGGEALLNTWCAAVPTDSSYVVGSPLPPTAAQLNLVTNRPAAPASPDDVIIDSEGRLLCDIRCRSEREQMEDAMDEFFQQNPHILVYSEK